MTSVETATTPAVGMPVGELTRLIETALGEDLRYGADATTAATVPADARAVAEITPRAAGVLAGIPAAVAVFERVAGVGSYEVISRQNDGDPAVPGKPALVVAGNVRSLVTAERTALNLVCHLSGVATATAEWVAAVDGTGCAIRDTRKTMPGMRLLQKYAVRCGGGVNHRLGLGDAVLIKDNHVVAAGSVTAALKAVRDHAPHLPCEVEVTSLDELDAVFAASAELVLLDNFSVELCAEAVRRRDAVASETKLEASGGLTLPVARAYAETGVDFLAVGALTHSAPSLDLGMDLRAT